MTSTVAQIAFLLRRTPQETEKAWRMAKRYCRDSGEREDYLGVLKATLRLLKFPEEKTAAIPSMGDTVTLAPGLKGVVEATDPNVVYLSGVDTAVPCVLVWPLWGFAALK